MSTENQFLPQGYEAPTSGGGYTKLKAGDNIFRILSSPLLIWLEWRDGKPTRHAYDPNNKPVVGAGQNDSVKHAWAMIVYNYDTAQIEILELDKQTAIAAITDLVNDADWGHPKHYNINIKKSGSGTDTKYSVIAKPKTEPTQALIDAFTDTPIDLSQLLVAGGNPFLQAGGKPQNTQPAAQAAKVVTPENYVDGDAIPDGFQVKDGKLVKKGLPF